MSDVVSLPQAGYSVLQGLGGSVPFSLGVAALDTYALTRVRFLAPLPLKEGMARAASFLEAQGRPPAAMAAFELRSPVPMTFPEFVAFNKDYAELLTANGFDAEGKFLLGRSNVAPFIDPPQTNTLFAFTYAMPTTGKGGSDFLISGIPDMGDAPHQVYGEGDPSPAGLEKKAVRVFDGLRDRVKALGCDWKNITGIQIYTARPAEPLWPVVERMGLANVGLTLLPAYPPVERFEFEADLRAVSVERVL